jgi:site-specific DNA-methyltransferase (adenine-specific)
MINLHHGDCIEFMRTLPSNSVDMVLTDIPFQVTNCDWDTLIPFDIMWEQLNRICKTNTPIVLHGTQPFTSKLICSNLKGFKYQWVWEKSKSSNFVQVKNQPLKNFEDILVFTSSGEKANYYPQMVQGESYKPRPGKKGSATEVLNNVPNPLFRNGSPDGLRYPKAIQYFKTAESEGKTLHPTQKPVALLEYLIRTYSQEGETVLDFTFGSGSTAIAALNTNRKFIGCELDETYFKIAQDRISKHLLEQYEV